MLKNVKVLNVPSQPTENSFRSSNAKRILTQDSPQINKENSNFRLDQSSSQIEIQLKHYMQENKKLNDLVSKLTKEKQELLDQINNTDFNVIKQRVERLESIIDHQSDEIEDWKNKYKDVCQTDQTTSIIQNMETQIASLLKENEKLNNNNLSEIKKIGSLEQIIKDLEYKVADQNNQIIAYEEERIIYHEQPNNTINQNLLEYVQLIEKNITDMSQYEQDNQQKYENLREEFNNLNSKMNQINFQTNNVNQFAEILKELRNNINKQTK
ncbi:unnamed protein product (macronuclear) [Paramecium tetraurelia]|uniref:Uncharacterized protein n=1 Tax=Paramecium tetraurelia TaxID=5888 RepID=A0C8L5_PARTE|nr:uncharacterized protein GSPATT00036266001 [Paramecium tetraurelia]CAK67132.1 unnamed protein product [Paramecium tetraurelia]|eukprot:XP_001434529.1 hypothetical protein (macronuclear) [Paramecium tetraurelia strain d4-2]